MCKVVSRQDVRSAACAVVLSLVQAAYSSGASAPTTVFNATTVTGVDGTNFSSLTVGINSSVSPTVNPNALINLDPSVIAGYLTNQTNGYSEIYSLNLTTLGSSLVALNDSNHQIVGNDGYNYSPYLAVVSPAGTILGTQGQNGNDQYGDTTPLGADVITSSNGGATSVLPLPAQVYNSGTGAYSFTNSQTGTTESTMGVSPGSTSYSQYINHSISPTGVIVGTVTRYSGDGTLQPGAVLGSDTFYYNPSTQASTAIGLASDSIVTGIAGNSMATGFDVTFDSNNNWATVDSWVYTPSIGSVRIGFVGGAYLYTDSGSGTQYQMTEVFRTNTIGQIAGESSLPTSNGDVRFSSANYWLYTPSATPGTASGYGNSSAGTYVNLGLTTPTTGSNLGNLNPLTNNSRYANINFLANNGAAAGESNRYDSNGTQQGQAVWYFNGTTNTDISPTDTVHAAVAGGSVASTNQVTAINNTGMVAAYATRITGTASGSTAIGQDAYIWDSSTNIRYFVDPTDAAQGTGNYEYSFVGTLGDNGIAVGYYNTYNGSSRAVQSSNIFAWTKINGLQLLATYSGSSAASSMANYVSAFQVGGDGELYGPNTYGSGATSIVAYGFNDSWNNSLGAGDGKTWDNSSQNWSNGVIPLVYIDSASVTFNDNNNHNYAVSLTSSVKPDLVTFNNSAGNYSLTGSGSITGGGSLVKLGSGVATLSTSNSFTGGTNVSGGKLVFASANAFPSNTALTVGSGATAQIGNSQANSSYLVVVSTLTNTGTVDITDNSMVLKNANASIGTITSQIAAAYHGGMWNGSSPSGVITSSAAAADITHLTAVGIATGLISFSGQRGVISVSPGDVVIKYTYYGDTNLDGKVDGSDYSRVDNGFLNHLTGWNNGDFNYDGIIDGSDYTLIDNAFNTQGAQITDEISPAAIPTAQISATDVVPEPGALIILPAVAACLLGRRLRHRAAVEND